MKRFSLFVLTLTFLMVLSVFTTQAQEKKEKNHLKVWTVGIGSKSTKFREAIQTSQSGGDIWNSWTLAFGHKSYRINSEKLLSFGLFTGSEFEFNFPSQFNFSPSEGTIIFPMIGWDIFQIGLAAGTSIGGMSLVGHVGAGLTSFLGMVHHDTIDMNYAWLGLGGTPNLGVRLFLSDRLSIGLTHRMGSVKTNHYINGEKILDTPTDSSMSSFHLTASF